MSKAQSELWPKASSALKKVNWMPLVSGGHPVTLAPMVAAALGLAFWAVATKRFDATTVGISATAIAVSAALAELANLGLGRGLGRFLSKSGTGASRLILTVAAINLTLAVLGLTLFLVGLPLWGGQLDTLTSSGFVTVIFALVVVAWGALRLSAGIHRGVGISQKVSSNQGLFGLLSVAFVAVLSIGSEFSPFVAWALPVVALAIVIGVLTIGAVKTRSLDRATPTPPALDRVMKYSFSRWATTAAIAALPMFLTLLVINKLGAVVTAHFVGVMAIGAVLHLAVGMIGDRLTDDDAPDRGNPDRHALKLGLSRMAVSVPAAVLVAVFARPIITFIFDADYASDTTGLLRLIALAGVPSVIRTGHIARLRTERRLGTLAIFELMWVMATILITALLLAVTSLDLVGLGIAYLIGLIAAAVYVITVESVWWWAPRLGTKSIKRGIAIGGMGDDLSRRWPRRTRNKEVEEVVSRLYITPPPWERVELTSVSQKVQVSGHEGRPPLKVELARRPWGVEILRRRVEAINGLGELTGLSSFRALLPYPIDNRASNGTAYLVESAISGRSGRELIEEIDGIKLVSGVVSAISQLHEATDQQHVFDEAGLEQWVSRPIRDLRATGGVTADETAPIERWLCAELLGTEIPLARLHGNLVLQNCRFDSTGRLTGISGWEWSTIGPALIDRGSLALSALAAERGTDLGEVTAKLLDAPDEILAHPAFKGYENRALDSQAIVLLAWLNRLAPTLRGPVDSHPGRYWVGRRIGPVVAKMKARRSYSDGKVAGVAVVHPDFEAKPDSLANEFGVAESTHDNYLSDFLTKRDDAVDYNADVVAKNGGDSEETIDDVERSLSQVAGVTVTKELARSISTKPKKSVRTILEKSPKPVEETSPKPKRSTRTILEKSPKPVEETSPNSKKSARTAPSEAKMSARKISLEPTKLERKAEPVVAAPPVVATPPTTDDPEPQAKPSSSIDPSFQLDWGTKPEEKNEPLFGDPTVAFPSIFSSESDLDDEHEQNGAS